MRKNWHLVVQNLDPPTKPIGLRRLSLNPEWHLPAAGNLKYLPQKQCLSPSQKLNTLMR